VLVGFGGYPDGVSIALIEAESCKVQNKFRGHEGGMTMVAFGPDGRLALSGTRDRDLVLWDVEGGRELQRFRGHRNAITSVAFSTDGQVCCPDPLTEPRDCGVSPAALRKGAFWPARAVG